MGIEISRLQATEAEAAMEVVTESFNRCVAPDYGSEGRDFFARVVTADYLRSLPGRNGFALVAKDHSRIVGLIAIRDERHITLFFVLPSFQRRGIGRRLFDAALDHVSTVAPLVSELEVHSSPVAVSAYQAFGFVVSAQEKTEEGIRFIPMVRPLGTKSISAYESKSRVAAYDASMDIMHPNRHRMADLIGDVLAACEAPPQMLLDLGTGTGFLLERLLARFPDARAIAVDGARSMVALAQTRLGKSADRVDLRVGDFRRLADTCREVGTVDAVVSTFALHHLTGAEKAALLATAYALLKPNGWLLSGDLIVTEDPVVESLIQKMRVRGIVARAAGQDVRFRDEASTRGSLRQIEEEDNDQPQHLASDLAGLAGAGFQNITVFWRETREVLIGGRKAA